MCNTLSRLFAVSLFFVSFHAFAGAQTSSDRVWTAVDESRLAERSAERTVIPTAYRIYALNKTPITSILNSAPEEFSGQRRFTQAVLTLPMPDGTFGRFQIEHSLVAEPGLIAKYPELGRTYTGRGIDDPTATVRMDLLPGGFHAMVLSTRGTVMIDPYAKGDTDNYLTYFKRDVPRSDAWSCGFEEIEFIDKLLRPTDRTSSLIPDASAPEVTSGTQLRTYKLALAGNWEYCNVAGSNTVAGCLAAMTTIMVRVNGVYERDLAIRMVMVANNDLIAYAGDNTTCPVGTGGTACTSTNDPYSNGSGALSQNTPNLNTVIGTGNYGIGHVFTTGSGGVANLSVPCGSNPGGGTTGLPNPFGDPFAIDYVAHEMGHQWGANHTFNGTTSSCGGNRSASSAYEPGSGITIMAYAGICGGQDLAAHSIDTFHVKSLEVIVNFSQVGNGNTCAMTTPTGNTPPSVSIVGGPSWNVPKQTPFTLTASGSDVNGDTLTYDWQEYDLGPSTTAIPNTDSDTFAKPIFRPFLPTSGPSRTFPALEHILNSANVPPATTAGFLTGELLPAIARTMNFQVVARDNRANGGGINTATATVVVDAASGPFAITAPNTGVSWAGNSSQTVTWSVANTTAAPVSAANVRILFSADGGQTFPTVVLASTANDGTESITVPNVATMMGRIKIEAVGNVFFDISDVNFTVAAGVAAKPPFDFDGDGKTDISVFRPSNGSWWWQRSSDGQVPAVQFGSSTDKVVAADYTGDGKADIAFWRPSTGDWYVLRSENFSYYSVPFGVTNDVPVPGDYDGDGKADLAIFRPSNNTWYIQRSAGGQDIIGFGVAGDKPVVGDYDGDAKADIAIFRPAVSGGEWWVRRSTNGTVFAFQFGASTDRPVQGRYTADNKTDVAFWRPSSGTWYVLRSEDSSFYAVPFGTSTDVPVPGDYDGDGRFDNAVFRPSSANWFIDRTTAGTLIQQFGVSTDTPLPSTVVP